MFGEKLNPVSNEVGLDLRERIFPKLGARVTSPDAVVLYNDLTGILLVRASAEELVAVQAVIETLGGAPTTSAVVKPSNSSSFLKHLAEGPHVHLHRAVTGMFDALGSACRREGYHGCAFINTAAESEAGSDVHARTVEHKNVVRAWVTDLARRAGAADPDLLARQLTILIDGGLSGGVLDVDPATPQIAKAAARVLVEAACPPCRP